MLHFEVVIGMLSCNSPYKVIFPELKALLKTDVNSIDKIAFEKILQIIKEKTYNDIFSVIDGFEKIGSLEDRKKIMNIEVFYGYRLQKKYFSCHEA